jgi:ATP-dependent Clp protease ATP-binding subunit ClpC
MFERFTDKARRVVVLAQEEARRLGHAYIGTEHILLGLLREVDGSAAHALESLGVGLEAARDRVEADAGRGPGQSGHIPFTPEAKRTLELSLREALQLGENYIDTEHILLGLVRDPSSPGARRLAELGGTPDAVRQRVLELALPVSSRQAQRIAARSGRARVAGSATPGYYSSLSSRLAALEQWAGMVPDLADLDEQIAQIRRDTEAAIDAHEFRAAEALSDTERELIAERDRRSRQHEAGPSLAEQVARLSAEVERLQDLLRSNGIDPSGAA